MVSAEEILLRGILKIRVIEAEDLPDVDNSLFNIIGKDVTDPYVNIYLGQSRMATTKYLDNTLNPKWNETFIFDVCA